MNIVYSLYKQTEGEIIMRQTSRNEQPRRRYQLGIGMIFQHFQLVPVMTRSRERDAGQRDDQARA